MWIRLLPLLSLSLVTAIPASSGLVPPIQPWLPTPHPPPACGVPVIIAAALPRPDPDDPVTAERGERVVLVNQAPHPVDLDGWTLRAGRRKVVLPPVLIGPGSSIQLDATELGSMRLRNDDGALELLDPCDKRQDEVRWGTTDPGEWLAFPAVASSAGADGRPSETDHTSTWLHTGQAPALRAAPMIAVASSARTSSNPVPEPLEARPADGANQKPERIGAHLNGQTPW